MKILPLSFIVASLLVRSGHGAPLADRIRIPDHGQTREFVVAQDEIHKGRRAQAIEAQGSVQQTREVARRAGGDLVLYEKGQPRSEATRRIVTRRILLEVSPGADVNALAQAVDAAVEGPATGPKPNRYILRSSTEPGSALEAADQLGHMRGVVSAIPLLARQQSYRMIPNDPLLSQQWHLGIGGIDVNVRNVWDTYRGSGITIGIVDDGLQYTHPDLSANYHPEFSHDFNGDDADPLPPPFFGDDHGTSCAGLAAARGNNGIGVSGVAFEANLAGIRLISAPATDYEEAQAFEFQNSAIHIKSNSWGPFDNAKLLEGPGPLAAAALEDAVKTGRNSLGEIFVWAGGNGAESGDSSSFDGYASSRQAMAVGGVDDSGSPAYFSEKGANLLICAPTSGGNQDITTTDRIGEDGYNVDGRDYDGYPDLSDPNYTKTFGGTSASAPIVAGCVALILQANPNLGWRDVQEILVQSAKKINEQDPGWITNGGGFHFHDYFGAGLINTEAAVALAKNWVNLPAEISISQEVSALAQPIPDNKETGVEKTFVFNDEKFRVEHVELTLDALHAFRGQLEVTLTSPAGTVTTIVPVRRRDAGDHYLNWKFTTTHHWGEFAAGTWKVKVADRAKGTVGTLRGLKLALFGSSTEGHFARDGFAVAADGNSNGFVEPGETATVTFGFRNDGNTITGPVTVSLLPVGGVTNPSGPVQMIGGAPGQLMTSSFTFTANGSLGQTIEATLQIQKNGVNVGNVVFPIILGRTGSATFEDPNPTSIPARLALRAGNARPYPATINASGLPAGAVVTGVRLKLNHVIHHRSADLDMLLVSPAGRKMIPMSDAGGEDIYDANLVLSDAAETPLPSSAVLYGGTYRPTNYGSTVDIFPLPAPPKPYDANFAVFTGSPAAGTWKLFIRDDASGASGGLESWSLDISYAY